MSATYPPTPPTHTQTVPPSPPTAFTGTSTLLPAASAFLVLAVLGAAALRLAARRRA